MKYPVEFGIGNRKSTEIIHEERKMSSDEKLEELDFLTKKMKECDVFIAEITTSDEKSDGSYGDYMKYTYIFHKKKDS